MTQSWGLRVGLAATLSASLLASVAFPDAIFPAQATPVVEDAENLEILDVERLLGESREEPQATNNELVDEETTPAEQTPEGENESIAPEGSEEAREDSVEPTPVDQEPPTSDETGEPESVEPTPVDQEPPTSDETGEPELDGLDFQPFSIPEFNSNPNVVYTLDRTTESITTGPWWNPQTTYRPVVQIRQLSFNMANSTPIAQQNTVMGGARTLDLPASTSGAVRSANGLGVTSDGVFYFTTQEGTAARQGTVDVWRYEMMAMPGQPNPGGSCVGGGVPTGSVAQGWACAPQRVVTNLSLNSSGGGTIVGGAVNPRDGAYYFMYYSGTPSWANVDDRDLNPYGEGNFRAHLYRYDANRSTIGQPVAGEVTHFDVRQHQNFGTTYNGDIAFDALGNLLLTVSNNGGNNSAGRVMLASLEYSIFADLPTIQYTAAGAPSVPTLIPTATVGARGQTEKYNSLNGSGINGLAYTSSGQLVVQQGDSVSMADPATYENIGNARTNTGRTGDFVDLASSTSPPVLTIQKFVDGERFETGDQFTLSGSQQLLAGTTTNFDPITTTGDTPGIQSAQIGPLPLQAGGTITARETFTANAASYSSEYECFIENPNGSKGQVFASGTGTEVSFDYLTQVPGAITGPQQMKCIFTNGPLRSDLKTTKSANPLSTEMVQAKDTIQYKLTFDNSTGLAPAEVDYLDYLADVMDDAEFIAGSIRYGDGTESEYPNHTTAYIDGVTATEPNTAQQMSITGSVPTEGIRTVWFEVKVKQNTADRSDHGTAFVLNNYLRPASETPPETCEEDDQNCTTHPVQAWTVSKKSQPPNGAWLHSGGNVYYMVDVSKVGAEEGAIEGIEIVDDMSQVMATARMDPEAPAYFKFDVKTYDANGNVKRSFADPALPNADKWDDHSAFTQSQLYPTFVGAAGTTDPASTDWKWETRLPTFTLRADEVRAQIVYIVRVGGAANPADPTQFQTDEFGNVLYLPVVQQPFVNTVGAASTTMPPNRCEFGVTPVDPECQVTHTISDNYFHIQKNSTERGADGNTIWNLADAEFEIRDLEPAAGWPADSASTQLCRTNYGSPNFEPIGTPGGEADWSVGSATYASIIAWNNNPANFDNQKPLCALFYALTDDSYGQAAGTWHARDLATGSYELVETKAPEGHQLLAEPVHFVVGSSDNGHQLDLPIEAQSTQYLDRCSDPNQLPSNGTAACVMGTGWLMQVYDTKLQALPLSGGPSTRFYTTVGGLLILGGGLAVLWYLLRRSKTVAGNHS